MPGLLVVATRSPAWAIDLHDNLYAVKAMGESEAWAVGNFGAIFHTKDAGRTWQARQSGTKNPLFAVDFADADHGWVVGKSALILRTDDGGRSWKTQKSPVPPD